MHHLTKAGDHEMLARAFNMVAVDAFFYGSYDVAYNYYMHARQEAAASGSRLFLAVIDTNLALIFLELRDLKKAQLHIRRAIAYISRQEDKQLRPFSLHAAYVDEAIIYLEMEKYPAAQKALDRALSVFPRANAPDEDLRLSLSMIRLRLAIVNRDAAEERRLSGEVVRNLREEQHPDGYAGDIRNLCRFLLSRGKKRLVGRIIEAVNDRILAAGVVHVIRMFTTLKVEYATACGDRKKLKESLAEQQRYLESSRSHQQQILNYTLELVKLDNAIRNDQRSIRAEHERLEEKAYHDALTGIANRHLLNKLLSTAFDAAIREGSVLGIGILDVDYFKEYNDRFGHLEGDACLRAVAAELQRFSEEKLPDGAAITCGRYGGDEFVMIYEGLEKEQIRDAAARLSGRMRELAIAHPANPQGGLVTLSQGICVGVPAQKQKIWDFLSAADVAMYQVKRARTTGRPKKNGVVVRGLGAHDRGGA